MQDDEIWTGPALANPRNEQVGRYVTSFGIQDPKLVQALSAGTCPKNDMVTFRTIYGLEFSGRIDVSNFTFLPIHREIRFQMWPKTNRFCNGYRTAYEFQIKLDKFERITILEIAVAPDLPVDVVTLTKST